MKKTIPLLNLLLLVIIGLVLANCETKNETQLVPKTLSMADKKSQLEEKKKWDASPDGIMFNKWKKSPEGKKIQASRDKIKKYIKDFSPMEAIVTSVTFQCENAKASGPKWLIVKIGEEEYMMQFISKEFEQLKSLKVNDKIMVKSRSTGYSPNHPYLILSSDYIAKNNVILFERDLSKNKGC